MKALLGLILMAGVTLYVYAQPKITDGTFTSFDGTKIYYEVAGTGKPVVLVHGFVVNSQSWKKTVLYDSLSTPVTRLLQWIFVVTENLTSRIYLKLT